MRTYLTPYARNRFDHRVSVGSANISRYALMVMDAMLWLAAGICQLSKWRSLRAAATATRLKRTYVRHIDKPNERQMDLREKRKKVNMANPKRRSHSIWF